MTSNEPAAAASRRPEVLLRRGRVLEGITLGWNAAGIIVLAVAALRARVLYALREARASSSGA